MTWVIKFGDGQSEIELRGEMMPKKNINNFLKAEVAPILGLSGVSYGPFLEGSSLLFQ